MHPAADFLCGRLIGGIGCITLAEPLLLKDLLELGFEEAEMESDSVWKAERLLMEKAELLKQYFMMEIEELPSQEDAVKVKDGRGCLKTLPNALGLTSDAGCSFNTLPIFLVRLCFEIESR